VTFLSKRKIKLCDISLKTQNKTMLYALEPG